MKVYVVQILNDIHNCYEGLNDTEIYVYDDIKKAIKKFNESFEEKAKYFENVYEMDLNDEEIEYSVTADIQFFIHNNQDYFHGRIIEQEVL